jgi:membrane protease YdiL (CAAX protease family)
MEKTRMELSSQQRARSIRNLVIFTLVTLSCGFVGIALDRLSPPADPMQGLGTLVWLVSPLAAVILLRAFGGDGWKDFGLRPNLRAGWPWYLLALVLAPLVTALVLALGTALGAVSLPGFSRLGLGAYLPLVGATFLGVMVKNIFEEFAWRGYLTPRFEAIRLHPFAGDLACLSGLAGVPYYPYFDRAELQARDVDVPAFIALAFLVLFRRWPAGCACSARQLDDLRYIISPTPPACRCSRALWCWQLRSGVILSQAPKASCTPGDGAGRLRPVPVPEIDLLKKESNERPYPNPEMVRYP